MPPTLAAFVQTQSQFSMKSSPVGASQKDNCSVEMTNIGAFVFTRPIQRQVEMTNVVSCLSHDQYNPLHAITSKSPP